jgi:hypothetical protein
MANRVILGQRGSEFGLWVSQPGINVLVATEAQLLLSMGTANVQVIQSGAIADPGPVPSTVAIPDMGFFPFVIFSCEKYFISIDYLSNTSIRFNRASRPSLIGNGIPPTVFTPNGELRYAVTNIPW